MQIITAVILVLNAQDGAVVRLTMHGKYGAGGGGEGGGYHGGLSTPLQTLLRVWRSRRSGFSLGSCYTIPF